MAKMKAKSAQMMPKTAGKKKMSGKNGPMAQMPMGKSAGRGKGKCM